MSLTALNHQTTETTSTFADAQDLRKRTNGRRFPCARLFELGPGDVINGGTTLLPKE